MLQRKARCVPHVVHEPAWSTDQNVYTAKAIVDIALRRSKGIWTVSAYPFIHLVVVIIPFVHFTMSFCSSFSGFNPTARPTDKRVKLLRLT